ncbi:putative hydro-lyase [Roseococcus sp. DSY-14]|uniref:putative hydro-lyase n=1 Tax=Roseococcus sp. DSY-14 TaxID=3369650 RepID=UPI00387AFC2E
MTALANPRAVRLACREGRFSRPTHGQAPGCEQANLVILPADWADEFLRFCVRNPRPCPVLGVSEPGAVTMPGVAEGLDLRHDLPRYRIWRDGVLAEEPDSIAHAWRDDLVAFALGCSFGFEAALDAAGLTPRHMQLGCNVPMFRTSLPCKPAGRFHGPMVVSMRPYRARDAIEAVRITARFPDSHGAPLHLGDPALIGIADVSRPDYGDPVPVAADELPVFWACGVTPQAAIAAARPPFAITHAPGFMLVTDRRAPG